MDFDDEVCNSQHINKNVAAIQEVVSDDESEIADDDSECSNEEIESQLCIVEASPQDEAREDLEKDNSQNCYKIDNKYGRISNRSLKSGQTTSDQASKARYTSQRKSPKQANKRECGEEAIPEVAITPQFKHLNLRPIAQSSKKIKRSSKNLGFAKEYASRGRRHSCTFCKKSFKVAQALGGHISKAHPNMSSEFSQKQIRRREREPQRELLKKAKEIYTKAYGTIAILYRNKLNDIKKDLVE